MHNQFDLSFNIKAPLNIYWYNKRARLSADINHTPHKQFLKTFQGQNILALRLGAVATYEPAATDKIR